MNPYFGIVVSLAAYGIGIGIGPALFNINEPIIFGLPMVMNPMMLIPFIITPLVTVVATYIAMSTGLVAKPAGIAVPWTMPPMRTRS